jgi:hypothetical protein
MLLEHALQALDQAQGEWPMSLVRELYVFGSFARGALEPHDIDLDVEHDSDRRWSWHFASCLSSGRNPYSLMKQILTGGKRGYQFQFRYKDQADFDMTLLWRTGDTLDTALGRLRAIAPDPAAGRAPRDAMLPQLEGLDQWIPRPYREALHGAMDKGAITIERLVLPDATPASTDALDHLEFRWQPTSPLLRAANAIIADWERRGIDPGQGHLHGMDIRDRHTPYFAGLGLRYFTAIPWCLTEHGGTEWTEVVHPTRTKPLDALRIQPLDRQLLTELPWS